MTPTSETSIERTGAAEPIALKKMRCLSARAALVHELGIKATSRRKRICQLQFALIVCGILFGGMTTDTIAADDSRTLELDVAASVTHDSNVFRLSNSVNPTAVGLSGKSDTISTASVGLRVDKPYAQQRFQLNVSETAYRYANFLSSILTHSIIEVRGCGTSLRAGVARLVLNDRKLWSHSKTRKFSNATFGLWTITGFLSMDQFLAVGMCSPVSSTTTKKMSGPSSRRAPTAPAAARVELNT